MGLIISTFENDCISAFKAMSNGDNKVFSEKLSAAVKDYAESGDITTADVGAVSAGGYVGVGTGKIICDASIAEKIIYAACMTMNDMMTGGNEYLAAQLAEGFHAMISAGEVETDVKGTVTPPSSSPVALNGTATGNIAGVSASIEKSCTNAFNAMNNMTSGGDEYMAQQLSLAVDEYLTTSVVVTTGNGSISGSTGTGKIG